MKAVLYDGKGAKKSEIQLPSLFTLPIREDIIAKYYEADKYAHRHRYASYAEAGKRHSASGTISHRRHEWKGHYGKGISRVPRKALWRRGTQFYWVGAEVANTRGGRRAHPPQGNWGPRKINEKERKLAWRGALAATADKARITARYTSLGNVQALPSFPIVIEKLSQKTKDIHGAVAAILGSLLAIAVKQKEVRAGRGKQRARRYKSNAGLLIITGTSEKAKCKGFEIKPLIELTIADVYPLGRLTLFTQKAIEELIMQEAKHVA